MSNINSSAIDVFLGAQSAGPLLSLSHAGNFTIGQTGYYQAIVGNPEYATTSGIMTFKDTLPPGLTALSIAGSGWTCNLNNLTCTISPIAPGGASYPPLTAGASYSPIYIQVSVAASLPASLLSNSASVTYGGLVTGATDSTYIVGATATMLTASPSPAILGQTVTLTATVPGGATGKVEFSDDGATLGWAALANGQAVLTTRFSNSGSNSLTAAYLGDTSHAGSISAIRALTVNASPATALAAPSVYTTGLGPAAIAIGDFNGDGNTDLVTANSDANSVSVLLGNGDGTYRPHIDYAVGDMPVAVIVGDFNNDGRADLALVNKTSDSFSILLGNGDGTFQAAVNYAAGTGPTIIATADFNGDGKADLLIGANEGTMSLFLGNGDGTFPAATLFDYGGADAFSIGDFNGDGKPDIAYTGTLGTFILLGNGDGTFVGAPSLSQAGGALAVGDLNRDGVPDIVVADSYELLIYLGNGDGTFQAPLGYELGFSAGSTVTADWNGDGKPDVICTNRSGGAIVLFLGRGDGTLATTAASYAVGTQPQSIAVGDFNNDGRTDAAIANLGSNNVSVMLGLFGAGSVPQTIMFDAIPNQIFGVSPFPIMARASSGLPIGIVSITPAVCKAAGNLVMILGAGTCSITASQAGSAAYSAATPVTRSFTVSVAAPSSIFAAAADSPFTVGAAGTQPFSVVGGDFNGDGNRDLAIASGFDISGLTPSSGNVVVLLGNGAGGFTATGSPFTVGVDPFSMAAGDFNAGGVLDLAVASNSQDGAVLLGNGAGGFAAVPGGPLNLGIYPSSIAVGDFNGDGIQDLVVADFIGEIDLLLGNGSGGFTLAAGSPMALGVNLTSVAVGDFNGDGIQDLAVTDSHNNSLTVLRGNGSGGFTAVGSPYSVQNGPDSVAVGDFNGDGIQDLAVANSNSNSLSVLLGNGSAGFTAAPGSPFSVGTAPYFVVVGDFNGDGIQDLATANNGSNNVTVLLGNGSGGFTAAPGSPYAAGSAPQSLTAGDLNGDGIEDLAIANSGSANVTVLLGVAVGHTSQAITFGTLGNVTYGVAPFTIGATSSSGLAVSFASTTPGVCTLTGATVTIVGGGVCSIVASQLGNATYATAAAVAQSFTVNPASQTITFPTLGNVSLGVMPFAIGAAANSGLAVSFASMTASVCTVSGVTVTLLTVGTCTIEATQTGSTNYTAATPVNQSFQVQYSACDLKQTGSVTVADVQLIINEALGVVPAVNLLAGNSTVSVVDVQIEINAALGLGCAAK